MRRSSSAIAFALVAAALAAGGAVLWLANTRADAGRVASRRAGASARTEGATGEDANDLRAQRDGDPLAGGAAERPTAGRGALAGRVVSIDDDAPIEGARVELHPADDARGAPLATATTGAAGAFRLDDLAPRADPRLIARADGFVSAFAGDPDLAICADATTKLQPIRLEPAASVSGRTVDVEGRPLAGVQVEAPFMEDPPVESDAEGRFRLTRLPHRSVRLVATKPGWTLVPDGQFIFETRAHDANAEITLRLARTGALHGRVRTRDGRPFPDASLSVEITRPLALRASAWCERCDAEGRFAFDALPSGSFATVRVQSPWCADSETVEAEVGGKDVEIVVEPWPLLALDVVDAASGTRLTPNHLRIDVDDPREGPGPETGSGPNGPICDLLWDAREGEAPLRTAPDGRILLPFGSARRDLEGAVRNETPHDDATAPVRVEWHCSITVGSAGHLESTASFRVVDDAAPPDVRVALEPAGAVVGRIVDAGGAPVPGAAVRLLGALPESARGWSGWDGVEVPDDHQRWLETKSGADGRYEFELDRTRLGPALVRARASGLGPAQSEPFAVDPQTRATVDVVLPRGGALEGRVTAHGIARGFARVVAFRGDGLADDAHCDEGGRYRFAALPTGRWQIRIGNSTGVEEGHASVGVEGGLPRPPPRRFDVEIAEGATARFDFDLGAPPGQGIRGVVHAPRALRRFLHVVAQPIEVAPRDPVEFQGGHPVSVGDDGGFAIPDLDAGRWRVEVSTWQERSLVAQAEATVTDGSWASVDLEVRARRIAGRVLDRRTGAPLALECYLRRVVPGEEYGPLVQQRSGPDGRFGFDLLAPDAYVLCVPAESVCALATVPIDVREGDAVGLDVAIDALGSLVVDRARLEILGFTLRSLSLERTSTIARLAPKEEGGLLVFRDLLPEDVALDAEVAMEDGTVRSARVRLSVPIGRTDDVTELIRVAVRP